MKRSTLGQSLLAATVGAVLLAPAAATASPAVTKCPASFTVLHNDKIGSVSFPAGPYSMTATTISCSQASNYFRQFLADWDGKLPGGWKLTQAGSVRVFKKSGTTQAFTATPQRKPTPTPTPAPTPPVPAPTSLTCPGSFQVLHNDRIGALSLPKGNYRITRLSSSQKITCPQASAWFAYFLNNDYAGTLPKPWTMNVSAQAFYDGSKTNGFRVQRLSGLGATLGSFPQIGESICSTDFLVGATTTVSGFTVPAGRYVLTATGSATCSRAIQLAAATINEAELPPGWTIDRSIAWFHNRGGTYGFRLDPGAYGSTGFTG
ncbi:MAG: hypothetical protein WCO96_03195 [Actinomycetes bacterium]